MTIFKDTMVNVTPPLPPPKKKKFLWGMGPRETIDGTGKPVGLESPDRVGKDKRFFLGFESTIVYKYSTKLSTPSIILFLKDNLLNFMVNSKAIFFALQHKKTPQSIYYVVLN